MNEKYLPELKPYAQVRLMRRFFSKVQKHTNGCWLWIATKDRGGYGKFTVGKADVMAHRFAYFKLVGEIPDGLTIDHLCRVRNCVNPAHLEPVTMRENLLRGNTCSSKNARKTHCVNGHEFTEQNIMRTKKRGYRQCRECNILLKAKARRLEGKKVKGRYKTKCSLP